MGPTIFIFKENCDKKFNCVGCIIRIQVLIIMAIKYSDVLISNEKILIYIVANAIAFLNYNCYLKMWNWDFKDATAF